DQVWGKNEFPTNRTIDTHVLKLRKKIETEPDHPQHLITVHGVGYKFVPHPTVDN
ncbi:MAG: winged helix-turn-helix domain-containing protein, partial [Planctomycetes bacterium]|nr:winged helix-turn-helix domain-containing protein [Planctomycetota bacterium]